MTVNLTPWDNVSQFVDPQTGALSIRGQVWLQTILEQIDDNFGSLEAALAAQAAAEAAQTAAEAAQTAAETAQGSADDAATSASQNALANSGVVDCVITGSDAGSNAAVSITAHIRAYGDGTQVSVNSGSIGSLAFSTLYYIYYLDPTRTGGAVTYLASIDSADAIQTGSTHSVGIITTPADGAPNTDGPRYNAPGIIE